MTVETDVSEADVLGIQNGQRAFFTTLGDADTRWETEVRQVLPTPEVLNDVVLYKALLDVDNPDGKLRSQMTAQVFFVTGSAKDAVLVPVTALQTIPNSNERRSGERGKLAGKPPAAGGGGFMNADAAVPAESQRADPRQEAFTSARKANPDATVASVQVVDSAGVPQPRLILTGLRTRTQAEVLFGLEPGETVVTGTVAATAPPVGSSGPGNRPPPFMGR